jgi:vancomycin resistance protein YoaR
LTILIVLEVIALLVVAVVVVVVPLAYDSMYTNRIFPGIQVLGKTLDGMTRDEARSVLGQLIADREGQLLTMRFGERRWTASAAELGLRYDLEASIERAYGIGRGQGFLADARTRFELLRTPQALDVAVTTDRVRSLEYMHRLARDIDANMQNAALKIENLQVVATPSRIGYRLDVEGSAARVVQTLAGGKTTEVELLVATLLPAIADQGIGEAQELIQRLIGAPVTISFSGRDWVLAGGVASAKAIDRAWTVERQQLAAAVAIDQRKSGDQTVLTARFDSDKFTALFTTIAKELNRKPVDARFDYNVATGRLTPTQVSQEGRTVDVAENVKRLTAAANGDNRAIQLAVTITAPGLAVDQASKMGIREPVAQGVSIYAPSSPERTHNIKLAASRIDNAIIAPGATFSLLDTLGEITTAAGYQEGFAIVGNLTLPDVGGGVCQVATTVFRAAFFAGLPIVERHAHSYYIDRYFKKGGPPGLDAAIYDPGRDLRFKNTTSAYLIVKTDASDPYNFTVTLYGTKPNWSVTMEEPIIKDGAAPGPPLPNYEDPTRPVGYVVVAQSAVPGMSASITRVVKQGATVLSRDTFNTTYAPARELRIVGTKK